MMPEGFHKGMLMKRKILLTWMVLNLISCSSIKNKSSKEISITQSEEKFEQEKLAIIKQLDQMLEWANNKGQSEKEYLASDLFLKASYSQQHSEFALSALLYKYAYKLKSTDQFIKNKYAISLIRVGELIEAEGLLKEVFADSKGKDERAGLVLAGVYTATNKSEDAKNVYQEILKNTFSQDACVFLSKSLTQEKSFKKAIDLLNGCSKKSLEKALFSYYKGKVYLEKGDLNAATKEFLISQKEDPDFTQATLAIGLIQEEKGQNEKAIQSYKKYLEQNSDDKVILGRIIQVLFNLEKYKDVLPYAEKLVDLEPDNLNMKVKLGIIYTDINDFEKAKKMFKDILVYSPNSDRILYYLGAIHQETNEYQDALNYFEQIPNTSALFKDSSLQIAHIMSYEASNTSTAHHGEKLANLMSYIDKKIIEIPDAKIEFEMLRASFLEGIEQIAKAISSLENVKSEKAFSESHQFYLASLYEKEKKFEMSGEIVKNILKKNPENPSALNFMGYSWIERGENLNLAHEYISRALKLNPKDGYIRDSMAWYYFKIGEYKKALEEIKVAKSIVSDDPVINKHLGMIFSALNNVSEAKKAYIDALKSCRFEYERKEINDQLKLLENSRFPASE